MTDWCYNGFSLKKHRKLESFSKSILSSTIAKNDFSKEFSAQAVSKDKQNISTLSIFFSRPSSPIPRIHSHVKNDSPQTHSKRKTSKSFNFLLSLYPPGKSTTSKSKLLLRESPLLIQKSSSGKFGDFRFKNIARSLEGSRGDRTQVDQMEDNEETSNFGQRTRNDFEWKQGSSYLVINNPSHRILKQKAKNESSRLNKGLVFSKKFDGLVTSRENSIGFTSHRRGHHRLMKDNVKGFPGFQNNQGGKETSADSFFSKNEDPIHKLVMTRPAAPGRSPLYKWAIINKKQAVSNNEGSKLLTLDFTEEGKTRLAQEQLEELRVAWERELQVKMKGSISIKFKDIDTDDEEFLRQTMPQLNKLFSSSGVPTNLQRRFSTATFTPLDVADNINEVEALIISKNLATRCLPENNRIEVVSKLMSNWMDIRLDYSEENIKKMTFAASHLFTIVDENLQNQRRTEEPEYIPHFFQVCDKIIVKGIEIEKQLEASEKTEAAQKNLSEVCLALNQLIYSVKSSIHHIEAENRSRILKGYMQNLFLVFYDLTEIDESCWIKRLENIGYSALSIPQNLDAFFSHAETVYYIHREEDFFDFFNRFYTCLLGLIIQSEFFQTTDMNIWKFILDLYSIHFILNKTILANDLSSKTLSTLTHRVSHENILLRYIALVSNIPLSHLLNDNIRISLEFNYVQINKVYQNPALYKSDRIPLIHKAIVKRAFLGLFKMIERYLGSPETQQPVISLNLCWMKIFSSFINYNLHFGRQKSLSSTFANFKASFQEILHRCRKVPVARRNRDLMVELQRLALHSCEGLDQYKLNMSVTSNK